jgi:hypothetical protein
MWVVRDFGYRQKALMRQEWWHILGNLSHPLVVSFATAEQIGK